MNAVALLQLMRLASPSLPVGGFSYSEGIETAVESGLMRREGDVLDWLRDQLHLGLARADLPTVAVAMSAWRTSDVEAVTAANTWFATTRETSEMRQQTEQMGRSLALWLRNRSPVADHVDVRTGTRADVDADSRHRLAALAALVPAPTWPVAFALAATLAGAEPEPALLAYAAGWAENLVQAAMKSVPLGQLAGQRILDALALEMPAVVEAALALPPADAQAYTPMLAILSSQHEVQYSRLFRS